jgi:hypothetical protein
MPHVIIDAVLMYVEADGKEASRILETKSEKVQDNDDRHSVRHAETRAEKSLLSTR